jgi:hypothetical protein
MMNTEKEELLELITHKLHFLESPLHWIGINNLHPLSFIIHDYEQAFKSINLTKEGSVNLPTAAALVLLQLKSKSIAQVLTSLPEIMALPGLAETQAKLQDRVVVVDDIIYQSATELEQLEIMAEVFYPKFFAFGHEGKSWLKLNL